MEFAVVAPILFLVFFAIVEFGRAMMVLGAVTNAARAGARAGAATSGGYTSIQTGAQNAIKQSAISATPTIVIKVNGTEVTSSTDFTTNATTGSTITVKVSLPYSKVSWLPNGGFFLSNVTLSETASIRREG